jgi:hypothetical protein
MIPHHDDRTEIKVNYYRETIRDALETDEPADELAERWQETILSTLSAIFPSFDIRVVVKHGSGEPEIRAMRQNGSDQELEERADEVARELWSHWATPHVVTGLSRDHESGLCERADVIVQADRPAEPERDWRPVEGRQPLGWGPQDGPGGWWGAEGTCYDLYVPVPRVAYEVREPGATAWEERIATLEDAQASLEAARNQGLAKAEILADIAGQRWRVRH